MVTESCAESRMRSRTSRGVPEWSGGKDLYMGSPILATGKCSGFFGIVPGRFWSGAHLHGGTHMNVGSGGKAPHPWSRRTKIPLRRNKIISRRDKIKIPKKGG